MIQYIDIWWYIIRCHSFSSFSWFNCQVPRPKQAPRRRPRWPTPPPLERPKVKPRQTAEERPAAHVAFWHQRLGPRRSEDFSTNVNRCLFFLLAEKRGCVFFFLGGAEMIRRLVKFVTISFDCLGWFWYLRFCFAQPLIREWRALRTPLAFSR